MNKLEGITIVILNTLSVSDILLPSSLMFNLFKSSSLDAYKVNIVIINGDTIFHISNNNTWLPGFLNIPDYFINISTLQ